jgi:threonine synthase
VQTEGGWPLRRAWERLGARMLSGTNDRDSLVAGRMTALGATAREQAIAHARGHRAEFMWPWETTPHSLAHGILDDETYDWVEVLRGLIESGGWPVTAGERRIHEAHAIARETTGIPVEATGTAGLAGLLELLAHGEIAREERLALLFTGRCPSRA